jgi:hypothetical protein
MPIDLVLPVSMTIAILTWVLILVWYVHPLLRARSFADALRPLLLLHCFRYIGLMFLIPGVTSIPLDPRFAIPAAYGDLVAAGLAFAALAAALRLSRSVALTVVWTFNVWGLADLLNAVARGIMYTPDGALGAAFWIPALFVPPLLVSHGYIFWHLLRESGKRHAVRAEAHPAR